jgi:hypothetical protein
VAQQRYIARAYAISNFNKIQYSNDTSFYTKADIPTVETNDVTNIQNGSADVKGRIIDGGLSPIVKAGICWSSTNEMPTIDNDSILPLRVADGLMSGKLTNLKGYSTYYVRAFATNGNNDTSYGNTVSFSTPSMFKTELKLFPGVTRLPESTAYFAIANVLYLLGGDLGYERTNELWSYTIGGDWLQLEPFIGGAAKLQTGIRYGNGAVVYGGYDKNSDENPKPGLYFYDARKNEWKKWDVVDVDTLYQPAGCAYSDNILYVGGKRDTVKQDVWVFNVAMETWSKKTDFPVKQYGGIAFLFDRDIYAGMGKDDQDVCNGDIWATADNATTWTLKTSCEIYSGSILAGVFSAEHKCVYVIDEDYYILEYNLENDVWTKKSRLPLDYKFHCMYAYEGKIYIGLGKDANELTVYDPLWDN